MRKSRRHRSRSQRRGLLDFIGEILSRIRRTLADLALGKLQRRARLFFLVCLGLVILMGAIFGSTLRYKLVSRKAQTLLNHDRIDEAISRFQAAAKIKPKSADAHNNLGVALSEKLERLDEALTELRTAVEINPRHTRAYFHIGNILYEKGQFDEAIAAYKKEFEINPRDAAVHFKLGKVFQQKGDLDNAIARFRKAIELEPKNLRAHSKLGDCLLQNGNLRDAIIQFEAVVTGKPASAEAHAKLALVLFRHGQIAASIPHWQKTLEIQPENIDARQTLGLALLRVQQTADAIAQWQKILEDHPDNTKAQISLAWVFATSPEKSFRDGTKALHLAEHVRELVGEGDPVVFRTLAVSLAECGRFDEAIAAAEQGLALATAQNQSGLIGVLRSEVALYQLGLPCHDGGTASVPQQ